MDGTRKMEEYERNDNIKPGVRRVFIKLGIRAYGPIKRPFVFLLRMGNFFSVCGTEAHTKDLQAETNASFNGSFISFISSTINSLFLNFELTHRCWSTESCLKEIVQCHEIQPHIIWITTFDSRCRTSARSSSRRAIGGREREKNALMWLHRRIHPHLSPGLAIGGKPKRRTEDSLVDDDNNWRKQREREHISTTAAMAAMAMWQWAGRQTAVANC